MFFNATIILPAVSATSIGIGLTRFNFYHAVHWSLRQFMDHYIFEKQTRTPMAPPEILPRNGGCPMAGSYIGWQQTFQNVILVMDNGAWMERAPIQYVASDSIPTRRYLKQEVTSTKKSIIGRCAAKVRKELGIKSSQQPTVDVIKEVFVRPKRGGRLVIPMPRIGNDSRSQETSLITKLRDLYYGSDFIQSRGGMLDWTSFGSPRSESSNFQNQENDSRN